VIAPLAVVIPALDAELSIASVIRGLRQALPHVAVIVVDDGSSDRTRAVSEGLADATLGFSRNRGKGAALRAGIAAAVARNAAAILTMDADGQHDPAHAPALLDALVSADIAIGIRSRTGTAMPLRRRLTNTLASSAIGAIVGFPVPDSQSGFRAFRRSVLDAVSARGDRFEFETDFLIRAARAGCRIASVPVPTLYGARSHFRPVSDSVRIVHTIWRHRAEART
jgi:glycosyltransferase involved in cell wall biosynthesis